MRRKYLALDGIRGLAAFAVVAFHMFGADYPELPFSSAYLAVDLFFGLSGFVLSHAYDDRFANRLSLPDFARLRLIRIYPTYMIGLALGVVWYLVTWPSLSFHKLIDAAATGFALLPVTVYLENVPAIYPLDGPAWSLSFEMIAAFCFAAFYSLLNQRVLIAVTLASGLMLIAVGLRHGDLNIAWRTQHVFWGLPRVFFPFFAGVLLHRLLPQGLPNYGPQLGVAALVALALPVPEQSHAVYDLMVVLLLFPLALVSLAGWRPTGTTAQMADLLGKISYPLYVIHEPCILIVRHFVRRESLVDQVPIYGLLVLGLAVAAWLIAEYYEAPVRRSLISLTNFMAGRAPSV